MPSRSEILREIFSTMSVSKRVMHAHFQRVLEEKIGLSPSQMQVLDVIARRGPISFKDLAGEMHMTPGAITQLVDSLHEAAYIERKQDANDRRITHISISAAAQQKLATFKKTHEQIFKDALATLDGDELKTFLHAQQKMLTYFENQQQQYKQTKGVSSR